jgi:hypothetical protein
MAMMFSSLRTLSFYAILCREIKNLACSGPDSEVSRLEIRNYFMTAGQSASQFPPMQV